jgi:hypothetical protein
MSTAIQIRTEDPAAPLPPTSPRLVGERRRWIRRRKAGLLPVRPFQKKERNKREELCGSLY